MSAVTAPAPTRTRGPAARPHLRVVRSERPRRRKPWLVLLGALFAAAVFAALTLTALAAEDAVLARELQAEVTTAERSYTQLLAEVAALESPERVSQLAEEMGLVRTSAPRPLPVDRPLKTDTDQLDEPVLAEGDGLKPLLAEQR